MCIDKRIIVNPTKDFRAYDNLWLEVPCGECEECRTIQHSQYYMRLKSECEWAIKNCYNIYFCTLTYKNSHLPKLRVPIYNEQWKEVGSEDINAFSRKDWSKFYDSIVKPLRRKYNVGVNGSLNVRYFIACEYGEERGRSHYHILIFVPSHVPADFVYDLFVKGWKDKHGKIFPQSVEGEYVFDTKTYAWKKEKPFQVNRIDCNYEKACYYCAKYACKETFFYMNENTCKYLRHLKYVCKSLESRIKSKDADLELLDIYSNYRCLLRHVKSMLPFHLSSRGFGHAMLHDFDNLSDIEKCKKIKKGINTISDNMEIFNFAYPAYIINKLIYDVYILNDDGEIYDNEKDKGTTRHIRRELNEFGRFYKSFFHGERIEVLEQDLKNYIVEISFNKKFLKDNNLSLDIPKCDNDFFRKLAIYIVDIRYKIDARILNKYKSYKGLKDDFYIVKDSSKLFDFQDISIPNVLEKRKTFGLFASTILRKVDYDSPSIYINNLMFKSYENIIKIINLYKSKIGFESNLVRKNTRLKQTELNHV